MSTRPVSRARIALVYDAVYPYTTGGAERRYHAIAEFAAPIHDVAIYGLHYWRGAPDQRVRGCRYIAVAPAVPLYTRSGRRSLVEPLVFALGLLRALLRSHEHVWDVASFPYLSVPVAWLLSRIKRRTLIVTWLEYWGPYWREYLGWAAPVGQLLERLALRCSPRIVVLSEHTRAQLLAYGVAPERITVVPNGVDLERIRAVPEASERFDLVYVGRLVPHKQVELLILAVGRLRERRPDLRLLIIGDGPDRERLASLARSTGVAKAVRFTGRIGSEQQVYAHMKSSRALVLPSRREGFGTVIVEAWACGIPVVVCQGPDNAAVELVDDPVKGRVAEPHPDGIAAACAELLALPSETFREPLISISARYAWARVAAEMVREYMSATRGVS